MRFKATVVGIASALALSRPAAAHAAAPGPTGLSPHLAGYQYLSPIPGSILVSPANNIVIRHGGPIDRATLDPRGLSVVGASSGTHPGRLVLADDMRTLVFTPDQPFAPGETVHVRVEPGLGSPPGESP
ncbi:MAG TPA: hypothetical protein VI792_11030, partial [Candidatus Eisenbacteria bacterium]